MKLISFNVSGAFAAFRDPSVTSNQIVYYIPSKSSVVGILGAMIGIKRSDSLGEIYGDEFQEFFKNTKIGIKLKSKPEKITFFTNHRSLKEPKTKPFKTELVVKPEYTIYVITDNVNSEKLSNAISNNEFVFSPYFGHVYCQAIISNFNEIDAIEINPIGEKTQCVVLDESESYNLDFILSLQPITETSSVIIERHIHHFFNDEKFDGRVLKHWIPVIDSVYKIKNNKGRTLSKFYKMEDHIVCMY